MLFEPGYFPLIAQIGESHAVRQRKSDIELILYLHVGRMKNDLK